MSAVDLNAGMNALVELDFHMRNYQDVRGVNTKILLAKEGITKVQNMVTRGMPLSDIESIRTMLGVGENLIWLANFLNWRISNARAEIIKAKRKRDDTMVRNWQGTIVARNAALLALLGCNFTRWYERYLTYIERAVPNDMRARYTNIRKRIDNLCIQARHLRVNGCVVSLISAFPSDLDHRGRFIIGRAISKRTGERTYFLFDVSSELNSIGVEFDNTNSAISTRKEAPFPTIATTKPVPRDQFVRMLYKTVPALENVQ